MVNGIGSLCGLLCGLCTIDVDYIPIMGFGIPLHCIDLVGGMSPCGGAQGRSGACRVRLVTFMMCYGTREGNLNESNQGHK